MNRLLLLFLVISSSIPSMAQKRKDLKKLGIKSSVSTEITATGTITTSKEVYNAEGRIIEAYDYSKEGQLKSIKRYKYNREGDVTEETEFTPNNVLTEKHVYVYNAMGDKTEEITTDAVGKQKKKEVYVYDARGLKIEKKTYDAENKLVSTKRFSYLTK